MQPDWLPGSLLDAIEFYRLAKSQEGSAESLAAVERKLILGDLFYLLVSVFKRQDFLHPWLFARCREVQANPDGYLDLWARDHRKSSCITYALTIQNILANPEITVGIFSHTKSIAKGFVNQIKRELENNEKLKTLFPDILWEDPQNQAPSWSLDSGLVVKRKLNPKEPTVTACGLVDGMPTGMHFKLRVLDDVVTAASVSTPEQMQKTLEALDLSDNLGTNGGIVRMIGTRYKLGDAYQVYMERGIVKPRIHTATDDGTVGGVPVFLTQEEWDDKLQRQSPSIIASQMLQNPMASDSVIFQPDWFNLWPGDKELPAFDAVFLSIDGAFSVKQTADDSCLLMLGLFKPMTSGSDGEPTQSNKYSVMILDCYMEKVAYPELRDEILRQYTSRYGANEKLVDAMIIEDKASGSALIPDLKRAGVAVYPFHPGSMDKVMRANLVSHLIRDGYVWLPESRSEKRRGKVMSWLSKAHEQWLYFPNSKNDDACFVAGTLIATRKGNIPIELVAVGDEVITPDGWRAVTASGCTGVRPVISNLGLVGTADHPSFQLDLGYQQLYNCSDKQIIRLTLCGLLKTALLMSLSSTESCSGGWEEGVTIIYRNQLLMRDGKILKACMSQFGNFIRGRRFLKATRLTIRMATLSISSLRIWSAYRCSLIKGFPRTSIWKRLGLTLSGLGRWLLNGINQKKEESGIGSTLRQAWLATWCIKNMCVNCAERISSPARCRVQDSVLGRASQKTGTGSQPDSKGRGKGIAMNVEKDTSPKYSSAQEYALSNVGERVEKVFNLQIEGARCYFANGVLVHNCDALVQALLTLDKNGFLRGRIAPDREPQYFYKNSRGSYS